MNGEPLEFICPNYDDEPPIETPPNGSVQVIRITYAEPRKTSTTGHPALKLLFRFLDYPEASGDHFQFLPLRGHEREKKHLRAFLRICRALELPNPGGKPIEQVCAELKGRYARIKVQEEEWQGELQLRPRMWWPLRDEDRAKYNIANPSGGSSTATSMGQRYDVPPSSPFGKA